jgi:hypothetical protein
VQRGAPVAANTHVQVDHRRFAAAALKRDCIS